MESTHMALANSTPEQKAKAAAYMREWSARNPEKVRAWKHAYYHDNLENKAKVIARSRARELANPEEKRARSRKYYWENIESERQRGRVRSAERWQNNSKEMSAVVVAWRLANPDKVRAQRLRSQQKLKVERAVAQSARQRGITGVKIVKEEISNWYTKICGICGLEIEGKFHVDHKKPLSKGGLHAVDNLQLAHPVCNLRKHNKIL